MNQMWWKACTHSIFKDIHDLIVALRKSFHLFFLAMLFDKSDIRIPHKLCIVDYNPLINLDDKAYDKTAEFNISYFVCLFLMTSLILVGMDDKSLAQICEEMFCCSS